MMKHQTVTLHQSSLYKEFHCNCFNDDRLELSDVNMAIRYLNDLPVGRMVNIGLSLGLNYETLRKMSAEKIHNEMVKAWLTKKDNVATVGIPTWKSLGAALQDNNLSKVAETIRKGEL